jgi:hypothetical protein
LGPTFRLGFTVIAGSPDFVFAVSTSSRYAQGAIMIVPAITIYVVLVWFLWGFFMALGWALGTWIAGQLLEMNWKGRRLGH